MEFLLDSACPKEIEEVTSWGLITGVTTNPSLYGKMADDFVKRLQEILEVSPGVVYTQVIGADDRDDMVRQARWIASQSEKIIVKLPMTNAGIQACVQLKKESPEITIAITAVATMAQAFLAGKAGADVCALFNGPLDLEVDAEFDLVTPVKMIYTNYGFPTKILSACRFARTFAEYCAAGTDIVTLKKEYHALLYEHAYTDKRMKGFLGDWKGKFGDKIWPQE